MGRKFGDWKHHLLLKIIDGLLLLVLRRVVCDDSDRRAGNPIDQACFFFSSFAVVRDTVSFF